jgi:hypothetical protein
MQVVVGSKNQRLRQAKGFERLPHRTSIRRRLSGLALEVKQQIALLGRRIVEEVQPEEARSDWPESGFTRFAIS